MFSVNGIMRIDRYVHVPRCWTTLDLALGGRRPEAGGIDALPVWEAAPADAWRVWVSCCTTCDARQARHVAEGTSLSKSLPGHGAELIKKLRVGMKSQRLLCLLVCCLGVTAAVLAVVIVYHLRTGYTRAMVRLQDVSGIGFEAVRSFSRTVSGRMWVVSRGSLPRTAGMPPMHVSQLLTDVSESQEFSIILQHMLRARTASSYARIVVDLGAFDGITSSNSYNLLQLGWRAVLVEAHPATVKVLRRTVASFHDAVSIEPVTVVAEPKQKGVASIHEAVNPTQHSIRPSPLTNMRHTHPIKTRTSTVIEILERNNVPKSFGVLDIDVEGGGVRLLAATLAADYRPEYIIVEDDPYDSVEALNSGYSRIAGGAGTGENSIFARRRSTAGSRRLE